MWEVRDRNGKTIGAATTSDGLYSVLFELKRTRKGYEDNFENDYAVYPAIFGINRATMILDKLLKWKGDMQSLTASMDTTT